MRALACLCFYEDWVYVLCLNEIPFPLWSLHILMLLLRIDYPGRGCQAPHESDKVRILLGLSLQTILLRSQSFQGLRVYLQSL